MEDDKERKKPKRREVEKNRGGMKEEFVRQGRREKRIVETVGGMEEVHREMKRRGNQKGLNSDSEREREGLGDEKTKREKWAWKEKKKKKQKRLNGGKGGEEIEKEKFNLCRG
jgi:hypothetical protein